MTGQGKFWDRDEDGFGIDRGREARDEGVRRRIENSPEWHTVALSFLTMFLRDLPPDTEFTSDEFREWGHPLGLPEPPHANSWGALFISGRKAGVLVDTGRVRQTRRSKGHARKLTLYRRSSP